MKRSNLLIALLSIVLVSVLSSCTRDRDLLLTAELREIEHYIGQPFSFVQEEFGAPDRKADEAIAWSYISETGDSNTPISTYEVFVSWGDEVGCYGVKYFTTEENAANAYDSALSYMGAEGRTIAMTNRSKLAFHTEDLRMARRMDTIWEVDKLLDQQGSHVLLVVSDFNNQGCHSEVVEEAMRIEQEYGIIEQEEEDLLFHRIDA